MVNKKLSALSFTLMLVLSIVAFGYIFGSETKMVSAATPSSSPQTGGFWGGLWLGVKETATLGAYGEGTFFGIGSGGTTSTTTAPTTASTSTGLSQVAQTTTSSTQSPISPSASTEVAESILNINPTGGLDTETYTISNPTYLITERSSGDIIGNAPSLAEANSLANKLQSLGPTIPGTYTTSPGYIISKDGDLVGYSKTKADAEAIINKAKVENKISMGGVAPQGTSAGPTNTLSLTTPKGYTALADITKDGETISIADQVNAGAYGNAYADYPAGTKFVKDSSGAIYAQTDSGLSIVNRGTTQVWGMNMPFAVGQLAQGLTWSLAAIAAIQTLGGVFGMSGEDTKALSAAATVGIMAGKLSYSILGRGGAWGIAGKGSFLGSHNIPFTKTTWGTALGSPYFSAGVAIAAAWLTYNAMYKKSSSEIQTVNFQCLPWQAPRGGSDCELCNDGGLPCSEYRCKSLGQSCKLINEGTAVEKCINANPRDVSPPIISPWTQILTSGYRYEGKSSPPGPGVKILANTSNGCLRAFQSIQFGVVTNEPSQCKIDIASTKNYSDMATFMGGDNLYTYNHSEFLSLPRASDFANTSITLENGKEMNLFVRCKDANGNLNSAEYIVNVCVDPTPDNTAPEIKATSIKSGNCVAANTDNTTVEFYTNEPSTCKWSFTDKEYSTMDYNMSCSSNVYEINAMQLYTCSALLTGIARDGTYYYVKCEDQPNAPENERNRNMESYQFSLKGSNPLKLLSIKPNQTIYGAVRPTPVELYTQTLYGCEDNKAVCFYSLENPNNYVQFFDTDKVDGIHTQRLDLQDGQHTVYVKCVDAGGNLAENTTSFNLEIDTNSPIIARAYQEDTYLKVVTQRNSECVYTNTNCDYLFSEGTTMPYANTSTHVTPWFSDKSYYIKCRDEFRNEPTDCSMIVRPTDNFL